jgi:polynucleotide 5'-hydroxyl-kinase GRC3/NOL9
MSRSRDMRSSIHAPTAWERLARELAPGPVLVVGATDTGKSTFAAWLANTLTDTGERVGLLDADMGQPSYGIPGTISLALPASANTGLLQATVSWFVGDTSPARHMLPVLSGVQRLRDHAAERGVTRLVIDTTGLVTRQGGGVALKRWKAELLRPVSIVALRKAGELEEILDPWRADPRFHLVELDVAEQVRPRSPEQRAMRRRDQWRRVFKEHAELVVPRQGLAIYEIERLRPGRLTGLVDACGFLQSPGIVQRMSDKMIALLVPAGSVLQPIAIWGGDVEVDLRA